MSKAPVRVRGMNAAAAHIETITIRPDRPEETTLPGAPSASNGSSSNGSGTRRGERRGRYPHASARQLAFAVVLLVAAVVIARYTFDELAGGPATFSGSVTPENSLGLNFTQDGRVTQILVGVGQKVTAGQKLATMDQTGAQAALQDAQAVLAADQLQVAALQAPALTAEQRQALALQVDSAQTQLSTAQQASQEALGQVDAEVGQAEVAVQKAQATAKIDSAELAAVCSGTAPQPTASPSPQVSGPSPRPPAEHSGATAQAQAAATSTGAPNCPALQAQVQKDALAVTSAEAGLRVQQANAAQLRTSGTGSVQKAQSALALAQNNAGGGDVPASAATLASAVATENNAKMTVDEDESALNALTLVAPFNGVIAAIGGAQGDIDGTGGVRDFSGPGSIQSTSGPAYDLFPAQGGTGSSGQQSGTDTQPLIWMVGAQEDAVVQVSEDEMARLSPGRAARVTVNALGQSVNAGVASINQIPVSQNGSVAYQVHLTVPSWPHGTVTGMSLSVQFP